MHLLLIEDNPDLVENLCEFFESQGHTVDIAYNGLTGLGFAIENSYDVIILDLMLPGMDGLEVCSRLRREGHATPILMLTARDTLHNKLEGFASGADDYLIKPFALPEIGARVNALLQRGRRAVALQRIEVADLRFSPGWHPYQASLDLELSVEVSYGIRRITTAAAPKEPSDCL